MTAPPEAVHESSTPTRFDRAESEDTYLTDGTRLYRILGEFVGIWDRMAALEDCRSLEVILVPREDLGDAGLRPVVPAASPAARGS